MSKYLAIFRLRFIGSVQYRAAAIAGMVTQFVWGLMQIIAFSAFHRSNPGAFPMEFSHTVSYIWLHEALLAMFVMWIWDNDITVSITSGSIAYEMVRPVDLYNRWFCQATAGRIARVVTRCFPILIIALVLPGQFRLILPPDFGQFALFFVSMILALGVVVSFSMIVYISMFYTLSPMGMRMIITMLSDFLSGASIPLPFFPEPVRVVAELLPFASMQNMPLRIYSGNIAGTEAYKGICLQVFWIVVLWLIGRIIMRRALKKVIAQGG